MSETQLLRRVFLALETSFEKALPSIWVMAAKMFLEWHFKG